MDTDDRSSPIEDTPLDRWINPATVRGYALVGAGLAVLALPEASSFVLRLIVGIALVGIGLADGWAAIRTRPFSLSGLALGAVTAAAGVLVLVLAGQALDFVVRVGGGAMAVRGALIAFGGLQNRQMQDSWVFDIVRGLVYMAAGVVLIVVPDALISTVFILGALIAIGIGGVVISFGVANDRELDLGAGDLGGMVFRWFKQRDLGEDMREDVIDSLYFEEPDSVQKQIGFWTLLILSVVIATLGVLADSTAVVIGAMLVAPLMTPIMGVSAAIVNGWLRRVTASFSTVVGGVLVAIAVAWIVAVWTPQLVPIATNSQILSRTSPTLIDLMIAVAAGAAGAYATVDKRVSSSITGVAIAVALVPPLGVVGILLEANEWSDALGAFLLFLTNLVSIILVGSIVFVVTGLAPFTEYAKNREKTRTIYSTVILAAFIIIVPLAFTSNGIIASASRQSTTQQVVEEWLDPSGLVLNRVEIQETDVDVRVSGTGILPSVEELETELEESLGVGVSIRVEYFPSEIVTSDTQ